MILAKYYQSTSMWDGKMGGACNTYENDDKCLH